MFYDPVKEGLLKADIMAHFFTFYPFVPENFFAFSKKFLVKG